MIDETRTALMAIAFAALLASCDKAAETPAEVRDDIAAAQTQSETDVAMAKAEGEYQVAIERCDALTGAERQACVDEAVQALNAAKDTAQGFAAPPQSQ
ncbi:MAG: hypothetical protein AB7T20_10935 [Steroidobacteraceae bacterium]